MGVERIAILKYGVDDIQLFFQGDVRFSGAVWVSSCQLRAASHEQPKMIGVLEDRSRCS